MLAQYTKPLLNYFNEGATRVIVKFKSDKNINQLDMLRRKNEIMGALDCLP